MFVVGGGLIINIPHGSAVDLNMSSLASAGRVDVYSSIDRRKHNLYNQKVTYQNSKEEKSSKLFWLNWPIEYSDSELFSQLFGR